MKLSVIMPVYNEIDNINEIIRRVSETEYDKEIIIVDDASNDGTAEFLKENIKSLNSVKVFFHDVNKGKTAAIRTAIKYATGDIIIIQDGDLEYNPSDYRKLISPIISGDAKVVYGSRFANIHRYLFIWHWFMNKFMHGHYEIRYLSNFLGIQFLNTMVLFLYGIKITDIATCYKVFRADVLKDIKLETDRFEFCYEVTAKIAKKHIKIKDVPIEYHPRSNLKGKKLTWVDGIWAAKTLLKYRFVD